jgi:hypothetical protein
MSVAFILSVVAAFLATTMASWSVLRVRRRIMAENRIKEKLRGELLIKQECARKQLLAKLAKHPPDPRSLSEAEELVARMLDDIDETDKKWIVEGLHQESKRGQADYAMKLLVEIAHCSPDQKVSGGRS